MGGYRMHPPQPAPGPFDTQLYANANRTSLSPAALAAIQQEEQRLGRPLGHSERGRIAMEVDGGVPAPVLDVGVQLHHAGETGDGLFQDVCRNLGMDPDAPFNTVYLPEQETDETGDATVHRGSHVQDYMDSVDEAVIRAIEGVPGGLPPGPYQQAVEQAVVGEMGEIRRVLLTNQVPLNARNDPEWDEETEGRATVHGIFEREGLFGAPQ